MRVDMRVKSLGHLLRGRTSSRLLLALLLPVLLRAAVLLDVLLQPVPLPPALPRPVPLLVVLHWLEHHMHSYKGPDATADRLLLLALITPAPLWHWAASIGAVASCNAACQIAATCWVARPTPSTRRIRSA